MTQIPPTQGAARETDFVRQTAEEVERRERRPIRIGPYVVPRGMMRPEIERWYLMKSRTEGR
jgi:hypothetical protein